MRAPHRSRLFTIAVTVLFLAAASGTMAQRKKVVRQQPTIHTDVNSAAKPASCKEPNGLTSAEIQAILDAHNVERHRHNLTPLTWNCRLANYAQEWAGKGEFVHRTENAWGENIFVAGLADEPVSSVVAKWLGESENYNEKTGVCRVGKVCTHYSQVTWNATTSVGCGISRNAAASKWKMIVVCNYEPAGNTGGPAY